MRSIPKRDGSGIRTRAPGIIHGPAETLLPDGGDTSWDMDVALRLDLLEKLEFTDAEPFREPAGVMDRESARIGLSTPEDHSLEGMSLLRFKTGVIVSFERTLVELFRIGSVFSKKSGYEQSSFRDNCP